MSLADDLGDGLLVVEDVGVDPHGVACGGEDVLGARFEVIDTRDFVGGVFSVELGLKAMDGLGEERSDGDRASKGF